MKLFSSYNKKGGQKSGVFLLMISLALLLILFLAGGTGFSGGLTGTVEQDAGTEVSGDIVKKDTPEGTLEVHFLDVVNGDSTLVI